MKETLIAVGLLFGQLLPLSAATAQKIPGGGNATQLVSVRSTAPRALSCQSIGIQGDGCFRAFIEITATTNTSVGLAYQHVGIFGGLMGNSHAYLSSGASCSARVVSGLGREYSPMTLATRTRPIRVIVNFLCDQPIRRGETTFMDLALWVEPEGMERTFERFPFPESQIQ